VRALRLLAVAAGLVALAVTAGSSRAERQSTPVPAAAVVAGLADTCALTRAGGVECWGYNGHDELGDGQTADSLTPVPVSGLASGVSAIAAGLRNACAITRGGGAKCWGAIYFGALGDGTASIVSRSVVVTRTRSAPVVVRCGAQVLCRGTATLSAGRTRLGSRAFAIATDAVEVIRVKLTPRAFRMVTRAKRLSARVAVAGGVTATRTITLVAP
jgi:hypothetical protein